MNFKSDNTAGVSPEIMEALIQTNSCDAASYGADTYSQRLAQKVAEIFEHEVAIYLTSTGTAANGLALSALVPAYGTVYCHKDAHINVDECGAPELFTGSAKIVAFSGAKSKIDLPLIEGHILNARATRPHASRPSAISITQATEGGTVYSLDELDAIKSFAEKYDLRMHMDGARFTNALVTLGCTPAQMTWKVGIDFLSFGATKNGAMLAEMIVVFNKKLAEDFDYRHKRAGQLMSKTRFIATQFLAYFENDLWLKNACNANEMAHLLVQQFDQIPAAKLKYPVESNEVFITLPWDLVEYLRGHGVQFYTWNIDLYRFVTSFATTKQEVHMLAGLLENFKSSFLKK